MKSKATLARTKFTDNVAVILMTGAVSRSASSITTRSFFMMRAQRLFSIAACLLLIAFQSAQAANIQTFNNRASWQTAASSTLFSITTEDFTDGTLDGGLSVTAGSVANGVFADGALPSVFPNPGAFKFQNGVLAFGGDWDLGPGGAGAGILLTATFDDGTKQAIGSILNVPPTTPFNGFFGFVSDKPVIAVTYQSTQLTGNSELFTLDNLSFRGDWAWWWGPGGIWFLFIIIILVILTLAIIKKKRPRQ
jgi:hypothetical protein